MCLFLSYCLFIWFNLFYQTTFNSKGNLKLKKPLLNSFCFIYNILKLFINSKINFSFKKT